MKLKKFLKLVNTVCFETNCNIGKCPFAYKKSNQGGVYCMIDLSLLADGNQLAVKQILKTVKEYEKRSKSRG